MPEQRVVLAEYFTSEDSTLLFIVRADFDEPYVVEIPQSLQNIRQFVCEHFREERDTTGQRIRSTSDKLRGMDEAAYDAFFAPFVTPLTVPSPQGDPMTNPGDILWFVPHDVLHYLPLHALKVAGQYLIERNPVCYTPSASVMQYCHAKRTGRRDRALILADTRADRPLLHAREQALDLQDLLGAGTEVYLGAAATKTLVKQRLAEAREAIDILHVACHGVFDADQALQSGIQLAPEDGPAPTPAQGSAGGATAHMQQDEVPPPVVEKSDDPWTLTAAAIFDLEMRADLVVLSACESGVNDRKPGDELIGLTRALIYAGTPSVVVSLWSVDEISTSILMRTFYQALRAGKNKAEALQQAQVDLMRMTAQDVIAYCEEAKQRVGGSETALIQRLLDWDIADLQFAARDFAAALHGYARIQSTLRSDHEQRAIKTAITRCQRALRSPGPIYYTRRLYCHPYYWVPFVVVGDWK